MIKRVVDKPKTITKTVKKLPEFNPNKIYVTSFFGSIFILRKKLEGYYWNNLNITSDMDNYSAFRTFEEKVRTSTIYILDNQQDLARFIMGCREFPIIEEIETTEVVAQLLSEDEVSVEDCNYNKIYATKDYLLTCKDYAYYIFTNLRAGHAYDSGCKRSFKEELRYCLGLGVYQFDTEEEYLQWAYEQTTGKKINELEEIIQRYEEVNSVGVQAAKEIIELHKKNENEFKLIRKIHELEKELQEATPKINEEKLSDFLINISKKLHTNCLGSIGSLLISKCDFSNCFDNNCKKLHLEAFKKQILEIE